MGFGGHPTSPCHSTLPQVGVLCPQTNLLFVLYSDEKHNASKKLPREEKEVGLGQGPPVLSKLR